jgi:hypothetical protein
MLKKSKFNRIAIAVAMSIGLSGAALAQSTTSSIRGNVASETGTIFPGATVTITHIPSGTVSSSTTNASGVFSARGLRVGVLTQLQSVEANLPLYKSMIFTYRSTRPSLFLLQ